MVLSLELEINDMGIKYNQKENLCKNISNYELFNKVTKSNNSLVQKIVYNSNTMIKESPFDSIKAGTCSCGCNPEKLPGIVPFVISAAIS